MATAIAGPGVTAKPAHLSQASFVSAERGMLRINSALLERVNTLDGVLVLTAEADRPVDAGTTLGIVKCAPLFLAESVVASVEDLARSLGPLVDIESFQRRRVALNCAGERLRGGAFDRAREALSNAVELVRLVAGPGGRGRC